jgi:hypothetical protein
MSTSKILAFRDAWSTVPYALLPGRSPLHQSILMHIAHMNLTRDEENQPTAAELSELCGVTMSTFLIGVRALEEEGIVLVEKKSGTGNRYFLVLPPESTGVSSNRYRNCLCITRNYVTHNTKQITLTHNNFESERKNEDKNGMFDPSSLPDETVSVDWVIQTYQTIAEKMHFPSIRTVSAGRRSMILRRIKSFPKREEWQSMFRRLEQSPHLSGEGWFSFSFIIESDDNFEKVTNGWMDWKKKQEGKMPVNKLPEDSSYLEDLKRQGQTNA